MSVIFEIKEALGITSFALIPIFHMVLRGVVIYFYGTMLTRFNKKLMGIRTPFNFVLFIMLGSSFANALVDGTRFIAVLITITMLFALNGFMTMLAFYYPSFETFLQGGSQVLVKNGEIQWGTMQKNFITKTELMNELERKLYTTDISIVKEAILASDGTIIFEIKK